MKSILLPEKSLTSKDFAQNDYVVFGGTFDPFHEGHLGAMNRLLELFPLVVLAPTTENPWKTARPTSLELRIAMIELVVTSNALGLCDQLTKQGVYICRDGYQYAEELVKKFRAQRQGTLYWAVGEDIADQVKDWKEWPSLGVSSVVLPIEPIVHAADIRSGRAKVLPSLKEFVKKHSLYKRAATVDGDSF